MNVTNKEFWCVRDPGPVSEVNDILFPVTFATLPVYTAGTGLALYKRERHTFYESYNEALADAAERLFARGGKPSRNSVGDGG